MTGGPPRVYSAVAGAWPALALRISLALAIALAATGCGPSNRVATYRVEPGPFVHRVRAEGELVPTQATNIAVPTTVRNAARIAWRAEDGIEVAAGEVVVRFDPLEMERELQKGHTDLAQSRLKGDRATAQGADRTNGVARDREVAELELAVAERFQKTDDSVFSRNEIIESRIDGELAADRKEQATQLESIHRDLAKAETDLLGIEARRAEQRIEQARSGLDSLEVKAPHAGLLTWKRWRGELPQIGQQVWGGQTLAEIPSLERMKAEVLVLEADAGGLAPGLEAVVRVEAHPEHSIAARITRVDAVAKTPIRGTPVQYFGVELELTLDTDPELAARLRPGQRVTATLLIENRDDALVVPRQALMTDRERPYVWLKQGRSFIAREVSTGPQSAALAVVEDGLAAGDVIALEPPMETSGGAEEEASQPAVAAANTLP